MAEPTTGEGGTEDLSPASYRWLLLVAFVGGVWLTHRGLLARTPAGTDVMGHVARTDAGIHLLRHGHLDGWFPTFGSGYRLFAVYGPGLALASGAVRFASLGLLHPARSFALLGSVSIALLPPTMATLARELGLTRRAALLAGTLALLVGSTTGGGLAGLYGPGLVPQAVAMPVQLLVLAGLVRIARTGSWRVAAGTALGVGWLLVLHPISLLVLVVLAPGLLFTVPRPWSGRNLLRAVATGVWGAAVAACWLLPAFRDRDLRGQIAAFTTPSLGHRLTDALAGRDVYPAGLAVLAAVALAVALGGAMQGGAERRWLAAPLSAAGFLVLGHLAVAGGWQPEELWVQLPNRGLALAGCLLLLPLAVVTADAIARVRDPMAGRVTAGLVVAVVVLAPVVLRGPMDPRQSAPPPSPDLQAVGRLMKGGVDPSARHLFIDPSPVVPLGTSEPVRWLASASGRGTAQLYFAEATRNPGAGVLPAAVLSTLSPAEALGPIRRAGITHVVVTTPIPGDELRGQPGYRLIEVDGPLAVYAVGPEDGAPAVADLLQPDGDALRPPGASLAADLELGTAESYRWQVTSDPGPAGSEAFDTVVVAPVAFDPGWQATVDGDPVAVTRSSEGLVRFTVPDGEHDVRLEFTGSRNHLPGILITILATAAALVVLLRSAAIPTKLRHLLRRPAR